MKKLIILSVVISFLVLTTVIAEDEYKPYLHKASVPEHPKLDMHGNYNTNLFPGAATYSYGIVLPKGTNDLQPSISLSYNSQTMTQRPGIVGGGWLITKNYIMRDINYTLNDTSDDKFRLILGGNSHELIYDSNQEVYHTKIESYMKIEFLGEYWEVTSKTGTKYRFGFNNDSRITSNRDKLYSLSWHLDLITDTHDNKIYYNYLQNPNDGDMGTIYPHTIKYGNEQSRIVEFVLEDSGRDDIRLVFEQGNKVNYSKRLKHIYIYTDNSLVRKYSITYSSLNEANSTSSIEKIGQYASDNITLLNEVKFSYHSATNEYTLTNNSWISPLIFSDTSGEDSGVRLIDVNRDGLVDVVKAKSGVRITMLNNGSGWVNSSTFVMPVHFINGTYDLGVRFAELNGDSLIDIIQGMHITETRKAWINNGSGWIENNAFIPPTYFVDDYYYDTGARLIDLNGDGIKDIMEGKGATRNVWLNKKGSWDNVSDKYILPEMLVREDPPFDVGFRVLDLNGDGLDDLIRASSKYFQTIQAAWLNNGSGWYRDSAYTPATYFTTPSYSDMGVRFTDINGDGLIDMLEDRANGTDTTRSGWLNTGNGWHASSEWQSPESFTYTSENIGRRIGDVNGDGLADVVVGYKNNTHTFNHTYLRNKTTPYLISAIVNEYGGVTNISYTQSTGYDNGNETTSNLGFNMWVVDNVTVDNSLDGNFLSFGVTDYTYEGGQYDYTDKEFRGFSLVNETKPSGTIVSHYFHQDDILKGKEYKTEIGNYSTIERSYAYKNLSIRYQINLDAVGTYLYDGSSNAFINNITYSYDDYGNVIWKNDSGDVSVRGDEKYESYEYVHSDNDWIFGKVSHYRLIDSNGFTTIKDTKYNYDYGEYGDSPSKGDLTFVEQNVDNGANTGKAYFYSSVGNVKKEINSKGDSTHFYYDSTGTYLARTVNALGHEVTYSYDLGTGNLLSKTASGVTTYYEYDTNGRIVKEIMPLDSSASPTKSYTYNMDGETPESITISQKQSGNTRSNTTFLYDGFGNLIQVKSPYNSNQQIVKSIYYDDSLRVDRESNPFVALSSDSLDVTNALTTNYTYDGADRVVKVVYPDGSSDSVVFDRKVIDTFDREGKQKRYTLDSHDRIAYVTEFNTDFYTNYSEEYNTSYSYDVADNLVKITDNEGNTFNFTYDNLDRKIALSDPDLGVWNYSYDTESNLVWQKDNVGNYINMSYDKLNRVKWKNSSDRNIEFVYDVDYEGTLFSVASDNFTFYYQYDDNMRVAREIKELDSYWFDTGFEYDSMSNIIEKHIPTGENLNYSYNEMGRLEEIRGYLDSVNYNEFGNVANRSFANNLITAFSYDLTLGRLEQIKTDGLQQMDYTYDNVGNVMSILDPVNNRNQYMGYDGLDRLARAAINDDVYKYEYNSIGNIKSVTENNDTKRYYYEHNIAHAPSSTEDVDAGANVYSKHINDTDSKNRTVEFYIVNEREHSINNVNWTVDFGDGNVVYADNLLTVVDKLAVNVTNNYANSGEYTVTINVTSAYGNDSEQIGNKFGLDAHKLQIVDKTLTDHIFEFVGFNDVQEEALNANWSCTDGVAADMLSTVLGNTYMFVYHNFNYTLPGHKYITCEFTSDDGSGKASLEFDVRGLEIEDVNIVSQDDSNKIVMFDVYNKFNYLDSVDWNLSSDSDIVSDTDFNISTDEVVLVIVETNYSTPGEKEIVLSAYSGDVRDSHTEEIDIDSLEVYDFVRVSLNETDKVFMADVKNYWNSGQWINWYLDDIESSSSIQLNASDNVMVLVHTGFNTQGTKDIVFVANSTDDSDSKEDSFDVEMIEISKFRVLEESQSDTIHEIIPVSNIGSLPVTFRHDTGEVNVTDTITVNDTVLVIIQSNYSSAGMHRTSTVINSSVYSDSKDDGVSVR